MKHLLHAASVGLHGYAYKQIGGDSGTGALLGPFKGRVFAIGPAVDYTFKIGKTRSSPTFAICVSSASRLP